jgi:hypothetical protein
MGCRVCQRPSRAEGDVITIPVNLAIPNSSPLFSEVSYQYIPVTDFSHIAATGKERDVYESADHPPVYDGKACN